MRYIILWLLFKHLWGNKWSVPVLLKVLPGWMRKVKGAVHVRACLSALGHTLFKWTALMASLKSNYLLNGSFPRLVFLLLFTHWKENLFAIKQSRWEPYFCPRTWVCYCRFDSTLWQEGGVWCGWWWQLVQCTQTCFYLSCFNKWTLN